jgi:MFS family permease
MVNALGAFGALLAAAFLFITGNGLLNTLLSTRMAAEGLPTTVTGMVLSCYFLGLLSGSFVCHRLIQRVGHIRAFAVFAAMTTAAAMLYGLYLSPWSWGVLRYVSGLMTFGLFMVIESWLNECTKSEYRGRVFALYMTLSYLGIGLGQQLLNIGNVQGQELFTMVGVIFALCLVPVSATSGVHPSLPETKPYHFMSIFRKAPLGMAGCMTAGLTNSAFFTMTPVLCTDIGFSVSQLSWIMSITVFAGLAVQWLAGTLSDRFDRTVVLSTIAMAITVASVIIFIWKGTSFGGMAVKMGLFGALMFAVYPVSVARAHDIFGGKDAVAVSTGLLFAYSIGASISPVLASGVITLMGTPFGLFFFWFVVNGTFAATALILRKRESVVIVPVADQVAFVPMKNTSPVVMSLDPRGDLE